MNGVCTVRVCDIHVWYMVCECMYDMSSTCKMCYVCGWYVCVWWIVCVCVACGMTGVCEVWCVCVVYMCVMGVVSGNVCGSLFPRLHLLYLCPWTSVTWTKLPLLPLSLLMLQLSPSGPARQECEHFSNAVSSRSFASFLGGPTLLPTAKSQYSLSQKNKTKKQTPHQ